MPEWGWASTRRRRRHAIAASLVAVWVVVPLVVPAGGQASSAGTWTAGDRLGTPRSGHTASTLAGSACTEATPPSYCGKVMVTGGRGSDGKALASTEIYDPATRAWSVTDALRTPRAGHSATSLADERVLAVGGVDEAGTVLNTATVFAPGSGRRLPDGTISNGAWLTTGSLGTARTDHSALLLANGNVLVTGGADSTGQAMASAEVYDPSGNGGAGNWRPTGSLGTARSGHTATLLPDGKVLVAGGQDTSGNPLASAEIFDPSADSGAGSWRATAAMGSHRAAHTATAIGSGVLVAGGGSAELFDPSGADGQGSWRAGGAMAATRSAHSATLVAVTGCPGGGRCPRVLVTGGRDTSGGALATAELFDPEAARWSLAGPLLTARAGHASALLASGQVVAAGGASGNSVLSSSEVFDPLSTVQPPSVTGVSPSGGPLAGGRQITITGAGFAGATEVRFGDSVATTFSVASPTRIVATSPARSAGRVDVTVKTPVGVSAPISLDRFTYAPPPTLSGLEPNSGGVDGGTSVTIKGKNLAFAETVVLFGDGLAQISALSPTELRVLTPAHSAGDVDVRVITPAGTSEVTFASRFRFGDGGWRTRGPLGSPRYQHTATLLPDGRVLVAGGTDDFSTLGSALGTVELYDPARDDEWLATGSMQERRYAHTATLLDGPACRSSQPAPHCGKVLVVGGEKQEDDPGGGRVYVTLRSAELYDTDNGSWQPVTSLAHPRFAHSATLLDGPECWGDAPPPHCGKVLVVGGSDNENTRSPLSTAELYNPVTAAWSSVSPLDPGCAASGSLCGRSSHTATLLGNGSVLVSGGLGAGPPRGGRFENAAQVQAVGSADVTISNVEKHSVVSSPVAGPSLGLAIAADPPSGSAVALDDTIVYRLAYFNSGTAAATAIVTNLLAPGLEVVAVSDAGMVDANNGRVTFPPVEIPAGTTATNPGGKFSITVKVRDPGSAASITNTARIEPTPGSGLGEAGSHSVEHVVRRSSPPSPPLRVALSSNPPSGSIATPGTLFTFTYAYYNLGTAPGTAIIRHRLPPSFEFRSASSGGTYDRGTRLVTFPPVLVAPNTNGSSPSGTLTVTARALATATNEPLVSAEIYHPGTDSWTRTGDLDVARFGHTATILDGPVCKTSAPPAHCRGVLVVGGGERLDDDRPVPTASAELYNPGDGTWRPAGLLRTPRAGHSASLLEDGSLLVAGGGDLFPAGGLPTAIARAEVYEPVRGHWRDTASMATARGTHTATVLGGPACRSNLAADYCGAVLVAGGNTTGDRPTRAPALGSTELYVPPIFSPTLLSLSPSGGPSAGGTTVVLAGTGFRDVREVTFGDLRAPTFHVNSRSELQAVAPPHPSGPVDVVVTTGAGRSPPVEGARFRYSVSQPPARVTDLNASAVSSSELKLTFSAPAADGHFPPPTERYLVKQANEPITDEATFSAAQSLCEEACMFSPSAVGDRLSLSVTGLSAGTTYHFALKTVNTAGQTSALSNPASATTQAPDAPPSAPSAPGDSPQTAQASPQVPPSADPADTGLVRLISGGEPGIETSVAPLPGRGVSPEVRVDRSRGPDPAATASTVVPLAPTDAMPAPASTLPDLGPVALPESSGMGSGAARWKAAVGWAGALLGLAALGYILNRLLVGPTTASRSR